MASGRDPSRTDRHRPPRELRRILIHHGFAEGPTPIDDTADSEPDLPSRQQQLGGPRADADHARRLRALLDDLGPLALAFGRYLASRADLLPLAACQALARGHSTPGEAREGPALDEPSLRALLEERLGPSWSEHFSSFQLEPLRVDLFGQVHRARAAAGPTAKGTAAKGTAAGGRELRVRISTPSSLRASPKTSPGAASDPLGALLEVLGPVLARDPWHLPIDELERAFRAELEARADLEARALSLRTLEDKAQGLAGVWVPEVVDPLCRPGLLVTEAPPPSRPDLGPFDLDWAPRLAMAWLQLALTLGRVEVAPVPEPAGDDAVAFWDGLSVDLSTALRVRLWDYLRAVAAHDPDRALHALWPLLEVRGARDRGRSGAPSEAQRIELRTRFRQAIPFRDGGYEEPSESLTEYAMLHWRWIRRVGCCLPPPAEAFFRGLFRISHLGRMSRPDQDERDPVERGLDALQWIAGFQQLEQLLEPEELGALTEEWGKTLLELPPIVDRLLGSGGLSDLGVGKASGVGASPPDPSTGLDPSRHPGSRRETWDVLAATAGLGLAALALAVVDRVHGPSLPWLAQLLPWLFAGLGLAFLARVARL